MAQVVESLNVADQASIVSADTASSISTYQVMYDNAHMISELEARVMILFWAHSNCLEVICRVLGVKEDTVRIYIDYRSLYASVVAAADLTRLKKNRKAYAIEYILARLALIQDSDDDHMWMLTLKAPKERKPSISSPEGHLLPADLSSTGVSEAANKILAEEASSKEKEKKRLEHQDELLKFIREKPADISSFDYDLYQKLKNEKSPRIEEVHDLPVLADIQQSKQPGAISNLMGKVWLGGNAAENHNASDAGDTSKVPPVIGSPNHVPALSTESSIRRISRENSLSSVVTLPKIDGIHGGHLNTDSLMQSASVNTLPGGHGFHHGIVPHPNRDEKHIYDFLTPGVTRSSMSGDTNSDAASVHLPNIRGSMNHEEDMRKAIRSLADNLKPIPVVIDVPETLRAESESSTVTPANKSSRPRRRSLGSAITPIRMSVAMNNSIKKKAAAPAAVEADETNSTVVSLRGRNLRRSFGMEPLQHVPLHPPNELPPLTKGNSNKSIQIVAGNVLLNPATPVSSTTL